MVLRGLRKLVFCALVWSLGCADEDGSSPKRAAVASLEGRVHLAPSAQMPAYTSLDLARRTLHETAARQLPAACSAAAQAALRPVSRTAEGLLSGIVIAASDFTHYRERRPKVHHLTIKDCRLQPTILAGANGDWVELQNLDAFAFAPLVGPAFSAEPLAQGKRVRFPFGAGSVQSLLCSRDAPCGRTDLIGFHHPVFAISDAQGKFRIDNFPAAELVRISAWHPLFEESQTFVWLKPKERGQVELELTPREKFVASSEDVTDADQVELK